MKLKELTKAEEEVMRLLWKKGKAFIKDLLDEMPEPKPAYNTVSTIVRILESKGFVSYKAYGKTHEYFPAISQEAYSDFLMKNVMKNYFGNSFKNMVSFFAQKNNLTVKEIDELFKDLKKN